MIYKNKFYDLARRDLPSCGMAGVGLALAVCFTQQAFAQPRYDNDRRDSSTIACASDNGRRAYCDVDTSRGVRLVRQLSGSACQEGSTWGFDSRGVWVDRGCRAEFDVSGGGGLSRNQMAIIPAGTSITVRTSQTIDVRNSNGQVFPGAVDRDVVDETGIVVIPRGSGVELLVRNAENRDLVLDLESVTVNGQRYAVRAYPDSVGGGRRDNVGRNARTGEFVGGGAVLGTIIGAIAGGGKGAAIGAAAGAGAGAGTQFFTQGRNVRIPAESLLTFRLERQLEMGVPDNGIDRRGRHYHRIYR